MSAVQLDLDAALAAADQGIATAAMGADPDWLGDALATVRRLASTRAEFVADDVWALGLQRPREGRALGAVMREAVRRGEARQDRPLPADRPSPLARCPEDGVGVAAAERGGGVMVNFGCAITGCEGHNTPEAAYQHWARTTGMPIRPAGDPRDDYTRAAEDERAEAERGFADWLAR